MNNFLIAFLIYFCSMQVTGQERFEVVYAVGKTDYKIHTENKWKEIGRQNLELTSDDSLRLRAGAQLLLSSKSNQQVYFHEQGYYLIRDVLSQSGKENQSVISAYAGFAWQELTNEQIDLESEGNRYMTERGGVSRADNIPVITAPFPGTSIYDDFISFSWKPEPEAEYIFSLWDSDRNGIKLFEMVLADTTLKLNTNALWIPEGDTFFWSVALKEKNPSQFFPIKVLSDEEKSLIESSLRNINVQNLHEEWKMIQKAALFEQFNALHKADVYFLKALEISANAAEVNKLYKSFLIRNGLQ